ncbi:hypothetical protein NMG60_11004512 [Bertholletia excelsa]
MESTIVIKVKYRETLRRFNACVNEAGQLDFDIVALKEKVASLFSFAPDADLTLTYVDEDSDIVTLVDDEDLFDVMRQSLNPLRITVQLNAEKGGGFYTRSSGDSTPMRSPRVSHPLPNLNNGVSEIMRSVPEPVRDGISEILRSVPEPVREVFSKVSQDLASKAASSAPGLADFVDCLSKMAQSYTNPVSEFQAGTESSMQERALGGAVGASMGKVPDASGSDGSMLQGIPNASFEEVKSKTCQKGDVMSGTKGVDASVNPASGSLNLNASPPDNSFQSGNVPVIHSPVTSQDNTASKHEVNKSGECNFSEKVGNSAGWIYPKTVGLGASPANYMKDFSMYYDGWKFFPAGAASPGIADNMKSPAMGSKAKNGVANSTSKFPAPNLVGKCLANDAVSPFTHSGARVHPFKRSYNHGEGMSSIFHRGVRCDGCGVYPITGPRFKSIIKDNYDLCSICFAVMGNEADYVRMDRPVSHRQRHNYKGCGDPSHPRMHFPIPPVVRDCMMKPGRAKLDSRFIVDVNVPDGAVMAPRTQFTKIWQMRNNGTTVWPQGTQLVWNGGDKLSDSLSVELQISVDGIPVENELDIAVDFTAPDLPGRYISYWRMASPSGQKFGQRVWVLIQVDASVKDTLCTSFQGLNLNLPPESNDGLAGPETVNVNVEPMLVEGSLPGPNISDKASELVESLMVGQPSNDPEMNFPINDSLLVNGSVSNTVPPEAPTVDPIIDLSQAAPTLPSHAPTLSVGLTANVQVANENPDMEQTLLKELEEMGFKQVDLNKEILRMNEYDLEQSVDDLCGVAEWDPMLEELQEMGFCDKEMNRKLLKKNNGSIKRVVMDLIYGQKPRG